MIDRFWSQHGPRTLWLITLGVAAILVVNALLVLTDANTADERVDDIVKKLRPMPVPDNETSTPQGNRGWPGHAGPGGSNAGDAQNDPGSAAVQRIRDRYLFMSAPPQGFRSVQGVLGDRVLYPGGQSFGLGENAMGATVVAIGSNWVELLYEEETITLDIFRGGERGPELMRWDGEAVASPQNMDGNQFRRSRGGGEDRGDRPRRRDRQRGS